MPPVKKREPPLPIGYHCGGGPLQITQLNQGGEGVLCDHFLFFFCSCLFLTFPNFFLGYHLPPSTCKFGPCHPNFGSTVNLTAGGENQVQAKIHHNQYLPHLVWSSSHPPKMDEELQNIVYDFPRKFTGRLGSPQMQYPRIHLTHSKICWILGAPDSPQPPATIAIGLSGLCVSPPLAKSCLRP